MKIVSISYWRLKDRYYRLVGLRCQDCSTEYFPPVYKCRKCGSLKLNDTEMPKSGKVLTYTILQETMKGFEDQEPLLLGIVRLTNGVKILAQIVDTPVDQVHIGDRVKAVFRRVKADGESGMIYYGYKFVKA